MTTLDHRAIAERLLNDPTLDWHVVKESDSDRWQLSREADGLTLWYPGYWLTAPAPTNESE